jgi:hypothetical protein
MYTDKKYIFSLTQLTQVKTTTPIWSILKELGTASTPHRPVLYYYAVFRIRIRLIRIRIRIQPKIWIQIRIPDPDPGLVKFTEKKCLVFYRKKITFPPCCWFIMRQCYTITQSAKNFHSMWLLFDSAREDKIAQSNKFLKKWEENVVKISAQSEHFSVLVLKVSHSKFWLLKPIFRHPDSE